MARKVIDAPLEKTVDASLQIFRFFQWTVDNY